MKHKLASLLTAFMMLSAVTLITGCNQLQGSKKSVNKVSKTDLQGVWNVNNAAGQYMMHLYFDGSTVYAAVKSGNQFVRYTQTITYNENGNTISVAGTNYTPVKNGSGIDLQLNGVTALKMTKDSSVAGDTIKNALSTPSTPGTNPGTNPGTHPGTNPGNSGNIASKADLQGVWKVSGGSEYAMHMYIEGATVYAATQIPGMPGQFVKFPYNITYNSDGTLTVGRYALTPVKKGEAIELQFNGVTDLKMTKDTSVTADSIKNVQ